MQSVKMSITEAFDLARKGNFMTHERFSPDQSLHFWNGSFYYEDGAMVTIRLLRECDDELFAKGWLIKKPKEKVNFKKLDEMHKKNAPYMLKEGSYEESLID